MIETVHAIRGRARFRIKELYGSLSCKKELEHRLGGRGDILGVSANPITGKLLVLFNSGNTPETIAAAVEDVLADIRRDGGLSDTHSAPLCTGKALDGDEPARENGVGGIGKLKKRFRDLELFPTHRAQPREPWHLKQAEAVLCDLGSSKDGLSEQKAYENIRKYGQNILPESIPPSKFEMFVEQFKSLPVALLGIAAGISLFTGAAADALVILGVVGINAVIGFVTESEAEKTIESLKNFVRPGVLVMRNGCQQEINTRDVALGDMLVLRPGIYVAADSRLVEADYLSVDESALTGESLPAQKTTGPLVRENIPMGDRTNMVFMGTLVTGGQGLAVVVAIGAFTELGRLQAMVGEAQSPETPMEKQLRRMGNQLVLISGAVCGVVFFTGFLRGVGFVEMFKTSIALAVAAVPEGLPAVATTTLALGIRSMKRRHVLIRSLDAVETLGSVQTICFDKTGTVTQNRMTVKEIWINGKRIEVGGGEALTLACDAERFDCEELYNLMRVCVLCSETEITRDGGEYRFHGSSTENALIRVAMLAGIDAVELRKLHVLLDINHRSESRHFMGTLHQGPGGERLFSLKGSPLEVLALCDWCLQGGEKRPLTDEMRLKIELENERMAGEALRVLGFAYSTEGESAFANPQALTWLGLVGMADPVREGVKDLIPLFHRAGIDTIMITGDQSSTAYSIGKELGLSGDDPLEILESTQLTDIDPEALKALSERVHVFARVSPANKLQIVQALQRAGRVVAMTGDGINDGPALKAADIGVALGASGTDIAREVADVVLEKDDLETMIMAVSQGRTIYSNIRKCLHFLLATNFSEIMVMFAAGAIGAGYPLTAMQLLWINLISDIFPGLALALEPPEPDVLERPPRDPQEPIVKRSDFKAISAEAAVLSGGSLLAYAYGLSRYGAGQKAGTLAFQSLTLGQLLHALSCRSEHHSIFRNGLPPNRYLDFALGGSLVLQLLTMIVPGLRSLLGLTPIGAGDAAITAAAAALPLLVNEARKDIPKGNPI